ncbi:PREDICTED: FAS-associated death domain protein-like [Branchiostoma belcheri]|uniref:FAS-associated death domain protein-like n=1 Tax=Branchiostoma belcheri TaxID=7741 RepID=A0A6P4XZX0_BRABE|nr:PREDICTED: FAS-associated death domain protein-like [Branchiostoma belcheri]
MDDQLPKQGFSMTRVLNRLAGEVGSRQWKKIAREIGLTDAEIDAIEDCERTNLHEKAYQTFRRWRMKNGRRATLDALAGHLRAINMAALADKLEDIQNQNGFPNPVGKPPK